MGDEMIYDADMWIGHWPFQALPYCSATDLLRQMDVHGIEKGLVGSLHGLFYKDSHEANRELARELKHRRDRLVPCAALNPTYYGWQEDLKQCCEEFGMPVLRLVPDYHGYSLSDDVAAEITEAAHGLKMRVALVGRIVDPRGRHRLDPGREADGAVVAAFLRKFPSSSFLMLNFADPPERRRWDEPACCFDIVRFVGGGGRRLQTLIAKYGADRLLFGTTLLMRYAKPTALALDLCDLRKRERECILWRNLAALVPGIR
jgi:hypothetical protein